MAAALIPLISELGPEVIPLVEDIVRAIKAHKRPKAAAVAAREAIAATPQTSPENTPGDPLFQE